MCFALHCWTEAFYAATETEVKMKQPKMSSSKMYGHGNVFVSGYSGQLCVPSKSKVRSFSHVRNELKWKSLQAMVELPGLKGREKEDRGWKWLMWINLSVYRFQLANEIDYCGNISSPVRVIKYNEKKCGSERKSKREGRHCRALMILSRHLLIVFSWLWRNIFVLFLYAPQNEMKNVFHSAVT